MFLQRCTRLNTGERGDRETLTTDGHGWGWMGRDKIARSAKIAKIAKIAQIESENLSPQMKGDKRRSENPTW